MEKTIQNELMGAEEALEFVDRLVFTKTEEHLNEPQRIIFRECWGDSRLRYQDIARRFDYSEAYLREVGSQLWQILSNLLEEKITKGTFQTAVERYWRQQQNSTYVEIYQDAVMYPHLLTDRDFNFLGRDREIAELNDIVSRGAKVVLIQGKGGVGKTTLARRYFKNQYFNLFLELWMATEIQNLASVESIVEEWLRRDFNEEPGRDFGINLERLRRKLRDNTQRIGVFIDNLETALDSNGKILESYLPYLELLRVLADETVNSVTLITSRERLFEASLDVQIYPLEGLSEDAWRQFFIRRNIHTDSLALSEMCKAYGGNAKAMQIICGVITTDFHGDIDTYWQENQGDLLNERQLNDLVTSQFNRLQANNSEAYLLLCRLGCYRYQNITSVPLEGVLWLLWDLPVEKGRRAVRALQNLSLLETRKGQYWLHNVIRSEAVIRLRNSEEWELVSQKAAEYWTQSVKVVQNSTDALKALEAYYHYIEIEDFEQAGSIILQGRGQQWKTGLPLGCSFYQLGLPQTLIDVITRIIDKINDDNRFIELNNLLGYTYRITGSLISSLECYEISMKLVERMKLEKQKLSILFNTGLCKMELWEIEEAKFFFNQVCWLAEKKSNFDNFVVYSQCCLAYLYSCSGLRDEALKMAEKAYEEILLSNNVTPWGIGHSLINLAIAYKNLGYLDKALEICQTILSDSQGNKLPQVEAKAISCLAEIYREQEELDSAIAKHLEAIEKLEQIGAQCDLAEAHYQLALTYQKMLLQTSSTEHFDIAIVLFQKMQAPRQVEKVQSRMGIFQSVHSEPSTANSQQPETFSVNNGLRDLGMG
ncbi:MAG: AAA family ATPase [Scytonema sp. PMC 1070.18]|nr:AAA family ATPase [Scytonema sp. PMC 1070.18]